MSRTIRKFQDKTFPDKKRKDHKDVKHFGFTSGTHSQWEQSKKYLKAQYKDLPEDHLMRPLIKKRLDAMGTYPVKGEDFIKYGYGKGIRKENKSKHFKKEI
jgi:hypothetical protein